MCLSVDGRLFSSIKAALVHRVHTLVEWLAILCGPFWVNNGSDVMGKYCCASNLDDSLVLVVVFTASQDWVLSVFYVNKISTWRGSEIDVCVC